MLTFQKTLPLNLLNFVNHTLQDGLLADGGQALHDRPVPNQCIANGIN